MSDIGLFIAKSGKTIQDGDLDFDSRRKHLLIDLKGNPVHFAAVDLTGTNLSVGIGASATETLLTIPHHLPYIPKIETYFFVSGNWNLYAGSGAYYRTFYPYTTGGLVTDIVVGEVDATNYYIRHNVIAGPVDPYTSTAASFPLKVKYYIFSNKGQP